MKTHIIPPKLLHLNSFLLPPSCSWYKVDTNLAFIGVSELVFVHWKCSQKKCQASLNIYPMNSFLLPYSSFLLLKTSWGWSCIYGCPWTWISPMEIFQILSTELFSPSSNGKIHKLQIVFTQFASCVQINVIINDTK